MNMRISGTVVSVLAAGLALIWLVSCGSSQQSLPGQPIATGHEDSQTADPASFPAFPDSAFERERPAGVSVNNNIRFGNEYLLVQEPGSSVEGTDLLLDGDAGPAALWGMWDWGPFGEYYPIKILVDVEIEEGGSFYILRSNYDSGRWEVIGPLDADFSNDGRTNYPVGNYISPAGFTYVVVLAPAGTDMTVHSVTVLSDDDFIAPAVPKNLVATDITPGAVTLDWDDVEGDSTLEGYNVYSGPFAGFQPDAEGVVKHNSAVVEDSETTVSGLVPGSTYHFAVSAIDYVGNESAFSESLEVETLADDIPGMPTDLSVDYVGSTTAEFSWTAPIDDDIEGYNIYIGLEADFDLADGSTQEGGLYPWEDGTRDDLLPLTPYWARVTAVDIFGQESLPTASAGFTTTANAEPQVDWINTPSFVQKSVETIFDPRPTNDPDNELSELQFSWDFNNDDVTDFSSTGPLTTTWTWDELGEHDVSLTVSDPFNTVELVRTITVNRHFKRHNFGYGNGTYSTVRDIASDPGSGSAAVLLRDELNVAKIEYFNGSSWSTIGDVPEGAQALALSQSGISVMSVSTIDEAIHWDIDSYSGSWGDTLSGSIDTSPQPPGMLYSGFAVSPSHRHSCVIAWYPIIEGSPEVSVHLHAIHERADGSLRQEDLLGGLRDGDQFTDLAVARDDTATFILDNVALSTDLGLWRIDDGASSKDPSVQSISGMTSSMLLDCKPGAADQVHWAVLNEAGLIHYGDNYGTANAPGQVHDAGAGSFSMAGCAPLADNAGMFYWSRIDDDGYEYLAGFSSGSGLEYSFGSDQGFASGGKGIWHQSPAGNGILVAVNERRDGEVISRQLNEGQILESKTLHEPSGEASIYNKSAPVVFADDSIYSLHMQRYPTMLVGSILPGSEFTQTYYYGNDSYVDPHDSCRTMNANEYFVLSQLPGDRLLVTQMQKWQSSGTESLFIADGINPEIGYSPGAAAVMLVYTSADGLDVQSRSWGAGGWSAPVTIATAATPVRRIKLAARHDGEYGLCYGTDGNSLMFHETAAGVWNSGTEIYDGMINQTTSYIGLDYNIADRAAIAVQRDSAGVWVGLIPDGGSVGWEEADPLNGEITFSLGVAHGTSLDPMILYQKDAGFLLNSKLYINERINGNWVALGAAPYIDIIGIPLGFAKDSLGNVLITGMDGKDPFKALCVIYYD